VDGIPADLLTQKKNIILAVSIMQLGIMLLLTVQRTIPKFSLQKYGI
jgi:hypothetical protein